MSSAGRVSCACAVQLEPICISTDARTSECEASALPVQNEALYVALVQSWRKKQQNSCGQRGLPHIMCTHPSAVHAKSMMFGAATQDLHSEPICETSTVETIATQPHNVAQNAFTANKTHVSNTVRCSTRQCKAYPSKNLPVRFAGLPLRLLETCDQHLGEIFILVPTVVTHVGQKQFVHNSITQASNACPSYATSAHTLLSESEE